MKQTQAVSAREAALLTLSAVERQGAWAETYLKKILRESHMSARDAALATRLTYGVLQSKLLLDYDIGKFSSIKTSKMEDKVLNSLRLGVFQILFLDKIPISAAVNESVSMVRKYSKNARAAGMVNAILRNISRSAAHMPVINTGNDLENLSVMTSHPLWFVEEFSRILERSELESLLQWNNSPPETMAQVNTMKATVPEAVASLEQEGVTVTPHSWLEGCLTLTGTGNLEELSSYREGLFYIQDAAARLAAEITGVSSGMRVLDACAAPGGKSFASAIRMKNVGEVISCDIHPHKQKLILAGAQRLGLSCIQAQVLDATVRCPEFEYGFDAVITDVPCSGLGIIRKKPDIRYKNPEPLEQLPEIQRSILENVAAYVRPNGVLLYSTCTLRRAENEGIAEAFLAGHPEFEPVPFAMPDGFGGGENGMVTLWPQTHGTDGFFIAKMRRIR